MTDWSATAYADVSGTPYEQGHQQGTAARAEIEENLVLVEQVKSALGLRGTLAEYPRLVAANERFIRRESPETLEEVAGIADGAGLPYTALVELNLPVYQVRQFMHVECTQLLLHGGTPDRSTYLVKSRDTSSGRFHQILLRRGLPDGGWSIEANVAGCVTWPGIAMNSHGLAVATSGAWSRRTSVDWSLAGERWLMLNIGVLLRTCTSVAEFEHGIARQPMLTPVICTAVDPRTARVLEVTPDRVHVTTPHGGRAVRTNHNRAVELRSAAPTPDEYPSTYHRYERASRALAAREEWTFEDLAALVADHDGYPQSSICRHAESDGDTRTLYSVAVRVNDGAALCLLGNPCESLETLRAVGASGGGLATGRVVAVDGRTGIRLDRLPAPVRSP
jgi:isopenicillin-N N-acyltransferase like protein